MTRLALGIVGAGRIASAYAEVVGSCDVIDVVGVADVHAVAAASMALELDCAAFSSHAELADMAQPDAVVVCTPPATHAEIASEMLDRGVHVMCEKPLAVSAVDARNMIQTAERSGRVLTMASKFRYVEEVLQGKEILQTGAIGEVILVENTFASRVDMSTRWNSHPEVAGGGVLIDNGTHSVDLVRFMIGPVAEVLAVEGIRAQGLEVEDTAQLFLRSESGARATVDLSWSLDKEREWYLELYGSDGTIQIGWTRSRYRLSGSEGWVEFGNGYRRAQAMRDQLANFAGAILGTEALAITAVDALASVDVVEAAYRSMAQDDWVAVGPTTPALAQA